MILKELRPYFFESMQAVLEVGAWQEYQPGYKYKQEIL